jgi:hypothetical protein
VPQLGKDPRKPNHVTRNLVEEMCEPLFEYHLFRVLDSRFWILPVPFPEEPHTYSIPHVQLDVVADPFGGGAGWCRAVDVLKNLSCISFTSMHEGNILMSWTAILHDQII